MAVTMRALGVGGMGAMVEQCCRTAAEVAGLIDAEPALTLSFSLRRLSARRART